MRKSRKQRKVKNLQQQRRDKALALSEIAEATAAGREREKRERWRRERPPADLDAAMAMAEGDKALQPAAERMAALVRAGGLTTAEATRQITSLARALCPGLSGAIAQAATNARNFGEALRGANTVIGVDPGGGEYLSDIALLHVSPPEHPMCRSSLVFPGLQGNGSGEALPEYAGSGVVPNNEFTHWSSAGEHPPGEWFWQTRETTTAEPVHNPFVTPGPQTQPVPQIDFGRFEAFLHSPPPPDEEESDVQRSVEQLRKAAKQVEPLQLRPKRRIRL